MILHVGKEWLDKCRNCKNLRIIKQDGEIYYRKCTAPECIHCTLNFAEKIVEQFEEECAGECAVCGFSDKGSPCRLIRQLLTTEERADK